MKQYVDEQPGDIIDKSLPGKDKTIGKHDGAIFYTIGQRHGLDVGGGLPYYVTGKNMQKNEVYVTSDLTNTELWTKTLNLTSLHWINQAPGMKRPIQVRTRHRAPLIAGTLAADNNNWVVKLKDEIRAATPGQSAVIYDGDLCLGGGIIV